MSRDLRAALSEFDEDDKTTRLVAAVMGVVPKAPEYRHARGLKVLMQHMRIDPTSTAINRTLSEAADKRVSDALWMASVLDTGDKGYSVLTGAKSAVRLFFGGKRRALDFDRAQRNDAVMKAMGLAYIIHKAIAGNPAEKVRTFADLEGGQMLIAWYAGIEIALPFADNLASSGARFFDDLLDGYGTGAAAKLAGIAGDRAVDGTRETLQELRGKLQNGINRAQDKAPQLAETARKWIPSLARGTDAATGIAAQAIDLMPAYRLLGTRFIAEATIHRATSA